MIKYSLRFPVYGSRVDIQKMIEGQNNLYRMLKICTVSVETFFTSFEMEISQICYTYCFIS